VPALKPFAKQWYDSTLIPECVYISVISDMRTILPSISFDSTQGKHLTAFGTRVAEGYQVQGIRPLRARVSGLGQDDLGGGYFGYCGV
jgi:hypothetical protein